MTLDPLDEAFLARWAMRAGRANATMPIEAEPLPAARAVAHRRPAQTAALAAAVDVDPALPPLVTRLLTAAMPQWQALADEVETARTAGHRVIAITGGERGEGRTTLVACLAAALRGRRRDVITCGPDELATNDDGVVGGGELHDKRIVLVDAGIWFPPGPIRRERLLVASLGCDAAIIVRRADREPAPAWGVALAAVGVVPLGEVVTFAAAHGSPPGAAA